MGLWDKIKTYGGDAWDALTDAPVDTITNAAKLAVSEPAEQFVKGLAGKALGTDFLQTEENFEPEVVDSIRKATIRALQDGRRGTAYEDYDNLPDGTPMGEFVRSSKARGGVGNFMELINQSPAAQAAFSVGRGSIEITDEGDIYFTDKYNFSGSSSNKGKDSYSGLRSVAGRLMQEDEGDTTGNTIRIYVGKEEEVLGREVKKGDTLGKIAKDMGVSIQELADYNGIKDVNKVKVGQRIAKPPVKAEPEVDAIEQAIAERRPEVPSTMEDMAYKEYAVQAGDSLSKIAARTGTTVADLVEKNNISNPNMIQVGQRLIV